MFLGVEKFTSGSFLGLSPFLPFPLHAAQKARVFNKWEREIINEKKKQQKNNQKTKTN